MIARPSGSVAEHRLAEHVEHLLLRVVLVHRDLLEDHLALGVDVASAPGGTPCRPSRRTRRRGARRSRGRRPTSSPCRCPRSARRPSPSKIWSISQRLVLGGALEQQVLEQVREPGLLVGLVAASRCRSRTRATRTGRRALPPSRSGRPTRASSAGALARHWARATSAGDRGRGRGTAVAIARPGRGHRAHGRGRHGRRGRGPSRSRSRSPRSRRGRGARSAVARRRDLRELLGALALRSRDRSASRRPIRPRSRSTSTTLTSISSPLLSTSSTVVDPAARERRWRCAAGRRCPWRARRTRRTWSS